jgi:hypothetical protein
MNQTYTTDYDEWDTHRRRELSNLVGETIPLTVPNPVRSTFKGFAFGPVVLDEDEQVHLCKTRALKPGESINNYDFSECYLLEYTMLVSDGKPLDDGFAPQMDEPWHRTTAVRLRYSGDEKVLFEYMAVEKA